MGKNINGQYVPSGALLLYEKYKLLSRKNSFAWCGNMYLAAETGLKPETCSKYTKILADAGMIARDFVWDDEEHTVLQRRVFVAGSQAGDYPRGRVCSRRTPEARSRTKRRKESATPPPLQIRGSVRCSPCQPCESYQSLGGGLC